MAEENCITMVPVPLWRAGSSRTALVLCCSASASGLLLLPLDTAAEASFRPIRRTLQGRVAELEEELQQLRLAQENWNNEGWHEDGWHEDGWQAPDTADPASEMQTPLQGATVCGATESDGSPAVGAGPQGSVAGDAVQEVGSAEGDAGGTLEALRQELSATTERLTQAKEEYAALFTALKGERAAVYDLRQQLEAAQHRTLEAGAPAASAAGAVDKSVEELQHECEELVQKLAHVQQAKWTQEDHVRSVQDEGALGDGFCWIELR